MESSIQALYERYKADVFAYLMSLTRDKPLAEDLTSETYLGAIQSLPGFEGRADVKTWLFSIARHKWYAHLGKRRREVTQEDLFGLYVSAISGPESHAITAQIASRIHVLLKKEPARDRDVVLMRAQGYSFYEISRKHGMSESSARVVDFRVRQRIRTALEKEGYTDA